MTVRSWTGGLVGTGGLVRLILRRDRVLLPVWILITVTMFLNWASSIGRLYPDLADRQEYADQVAGTPVFMLFQGQVFDASIGGVVAQRGLAQAAMTAALGAALFVVRHTRGEEQAGRRELLGSTVVGRHAPLTAALGVVFAAGVVVGVVSTVGLIAVGLPAAGSVASGVLLCLTTWLVAALAGLIAQFAESVAVAGITVLGLYFAGHLVRGVAAFGSDGASALTWFVPNGWLEQLRPYTGDHWWVLAPTVLLVAALLAAAYAVSARRDLGAGLFGHRPGPARGAAYLKSPLGLAWRLNRGALAGWAIGITLFGLVLGFIGAGAMEEYAQSKWAAEFAEAMGAESPAHGFLLYLSFATSFFIAGYAIMTALRPRRQEADGYAETVLSTASRRSGWLLGQLVFALGGPVVLLFLLGLGQGLGTALSGTGGRSLGAELVDKIGLTVPIVPSIWVLVGVAVLAFGLLPRACAVIAWAAFALGIAAELAVKMGLIPDWVFVSVSPYAHVNPYYGATALDYTGLTVLAVLLLALGLTTFARRDLRTG